MCDYYKDRGALVQLRAHGVGDVWYGININYGGGGLDSSVYPYNMLCNKYYYI